MGNCVCRTETVWTETLIIVLQLQLRPRFMNWTMYSLSRDYSRTLLRKKSFAIFDSLIEDKLLRDFNLHFICVWWCRRVSVFSNFDVWVLDLSYSPTTIPLFRPFVTDSDEVAWDHVAGSRAQIALSKVKRCFPLRLLSFVVYELGLSISRLMHFYAPRK